MFVVVLLIVTREEGRRSLLSTEMVTGEAGLLTSTARGLQVSVRGSQLTAAVLVILVISGDLRISSSVNIFLTSVRVSHSTQSIPQSHLV